jgi:hypothetical protein
LALNVVCHPILVGLGEVTDSRRGWRYRKNQCDCCENREKLVEHGGTILVGQNVTIFEDYSEKGKTR